MAFDLSFEGYRIDPTRDQMQWFQLCSDVKIPKPTYLTLTFLLALFLSFSNLSSILYSTS